MPTTRSYILALVGNKVGRPEHLHQPEFESSHFVRQNLLRDCFEFAAGLRQRDQAKGFIRFTDGTQLSISLPAAGIEPFETDTTELVFIGKKVSPEKDAILRALGECVAQNDEARMTNAEGKTKHELL